MEKVYRTQDVENSEDSINNETNTTRRKNEIYKYRWHDEKNNSAALKNTDAWADNDLNALLQ